MPPPLIPILKLYLIIGLSVLFADNTKGDTTIVMTFQKNQTSCILHDSIVPDTKFNFHNIGSAQLRFNLSMHGDSCMNCLNSLTLMPTESIDMTASELGFDNTGQHLNGTNLSSSQMGKIKIIVILKPQPECDPHPVEKQGGGTVKVTSIWKYGSNRIFPCPTNTRLGLGTENPTNPLHISGGSPSIKLQDNFVQSGTTEKTDFTISADNGVTRLISNQSLSMFINGDNNDADTRFFSVIKNASAFVNQTTLFQINENGNVGIGTILSSNTNNYKLAVNGTIGAKDLWIENTSSTWPDYVLEKEYKLKTLQELEVFINKNKHLPNMSSTDIIKNSNSLSISEVLLKQQVKIEELTLYIIELNKKIEKLGGKK